MSRAHGPDFTGRGRRVAASQKAQGDATDSAAAALATRVTEVEERVTELEDAPPVTTGNLVRTVITLTAAQVATLGATPGPSYLELSPDLPAWTHIVNGTFRLTTPFVSSVPGYDLTAEFLWRARDSVAPDVIPYDTVPKTGYVIGSDAAVLSPYDSMGSAFINDSPFGANTAPYRWPYTPTPVLKLTAGGVGTPNLDSFTDGELEIVILSVTML